MRCALFLSLKQEKGSAVTGFALVAPLVVCMFVVVIQVASMLADRVTLTMAAQSGVRVASTLDGTNAQGRSKALSVLQSRRMDKQSVVTFVDEGRGGMHYVVCTVSSHRHIAWLNREITMTVQARAIDEGTL